MGMEYDRGLAATFDPAWQRWYDGTRPVKDWLRKIATDRMVVVYNDHLTEFGWHVTNCLVRGEFDMTVCQHLAIDHGIYSWFPYLFELPWRIPVTPIAVNMVRHPIPTSRRLHKLGAALRSAISEFPRKERVLVIATGGMSHQISGARFGMANEDLDRFFLRKLQSHWSVLVDIPQETLMRLGGTEAAELSIWFAMRGALSDQIEKIHSFQTFPKITGCGVIVFEEAGVNWVDPKPKSSVR